jgi:hypothetical protein
MKNFIITSKVQSIKILQYNVEAESLEEAIEQVKLTNAPYEELDDKIDFDTEDSFKGWEDRDRIIGGPRNTKTISYISV